MGLYVHTLEELEILDKATAAYELILTTALTRNDTLTHQDDFDKRLTREEIEEVHVNLGKIRNFRQRLLTGEPSTRPKLFD